MKTLINIKADKKVKVEAKKAAEELGLPLSTIINACLKQFIRDRMIYFSAMPRMTPELEKLVGTARKDFKRKKNVVGPFASAEEMDRYIDSF